MAIILRFPESIKHFYAMSFDYDLTKGDIINLAALDNERTEELAWNYKYSCPDCWINKEICTSPESLRPYNFLLSSVFQN
jgi:hypothetical protein